MRNLLVALFVILATPGGIAATATVDDNGEKPLQRNGSTDFHQVLDQLVSLSINRDPELRSILGLTDDDIGDLSHRMTDVSLPRRAQLREQLKQALEEVSSYDRQSLEGQERWSYDLAVWLYRTQIDLMAFEWFRSVRLVVDTSLHRKRWTPEMAIAVHRRKESYKFLL